MFWSRLFYLLKLSKHLLFFRKSVPAVLFFETIIHPAGIFAPLTVGARRNILFPVGFGETTGSQTWERSVVDKADFVIRHQKAAVALGARERWELGLVVVRRRCCAEWSGNQDAFLLPSLCVFARMIFVEPFDVIRDISYARPCLWNLWSWHSQHCILPCRDTSPCDLEGSVEFGGVVEVLCTLELATTGVGHSDNSGKRDVVVLFHLLPEPSELKISMVLVTTRWIRFVSKVSGNAQKWTFQPRPDRSPKMSF